jgi:hypothetical protein
VVDRRLGPRKRIVHPQYDASRRPRRSFRIGLLCSVGKGKSRDGHAGVVDVHDSRIGIKRIAKRLETQACSFPRVIPAIDIWRAATLMLKRYGGKALEESPARADELAAEGDHDGEVTWCRITDAVVQLSNKTPPGLVH